MKRKGRKKTTSTVGEGSMEESEGEGEWMKRIR